MYHWFVLDIERAFDSLEDKLSGESLEAARLQFIRGYKEERCYTREMEESRPFMRRFINLYGYARLIRCVAEKLAHEPQWMTELRQKLDKAILKKEANMLKS